MGGLGCQGVGKAPGRAGQNRANVNEKQFHLRIA
jgi:hypothetical protein